MTILCRKIGNTSTCQKNKSLETTLSSLFPTNDTAFHKYVRAHFLPMMNWFDPDLSEVMSLLKQKMTLYIEDKEITDKIKQPRKIYHGIGDQGLRNLNTSSLTE